MGYQWSYQIDRETDRLTDWLIDIQRCNLRLLAMCLSLVCYHLTDNHHKKNAYYLALLQLMMIFDYDDDDDYDDTGADGNVLFRWNERYAVLY